MYLTIRCGISPNYGDLLPCSGIYKKPFRISLPIRFSDPSEIIPGFQMRRLRLVVFIQSISENGAFKIFAC